jgi:predicted DNA-binding helix-hairpin-helix protein
MHRAGVVEGFFLSSGIDGSPDRAMQSMLDTATLVRRGGFRGYLHLKILPGASQGAVESALRLADRVSVNLEAPTEAAVRRLSPTKGLNLLMRPLQVAARLARARGRGSRVTTTTQLVVGGAGESDAEILGCAAALYDGRLVSRCYYSAFSPPEEGPLAAVEPTPKLRTVRLYQADWLLRFFGYTHDELPLDDAGALDLSQDPKTLWAARHPEHFPLEINTASRGQLLRVPGIGPTGADRIISARRRERLRSPERLRPLGVRWRAASPYLTFDGRLGVRRPVQLPLAGMTAIS